MSVEKQLRVAALEAACRVYEGKGRDAYWSDILSLARDFLSFLEEGDD